MHSITVLNRDLVIVDPRPRDYEGFAVDAADDQLRIRFYSSGDEAIRSEPAIIDGLWLINLRLLDITGIELLASVRQRDPHAAVFLVGDSYDHKDEIVARAAGPTAYVCKPPHSTWLSGVRPRPRARPIGQTLVVRAYTQPAAYY